MYTSITKPELSTVTQKGQVTIPIAIRDYWGLQPQEQVVFIRKQGAVEIKPAVNFFELKGSIKTKKKFSDQSANRAVGSHLSKKYEQESKNEPTTVKT